MKSIAITMGALLLIASQAHAADVEAGKAKVAEVCSACHGQDGNSASPEFPRLAGQNEDYIRNALKSYQSGARKNPIMASMAEGLSKADIENVAAYFSSQKGLFVKHDN